MSAYKLLTMKLRHGFTLIELLVVISIMTTILSFVGPLMIEQVDKTRAAAEFRQLQQYISDSAKVAFLKGQPVSFVFDGKQLQRELGENQVTVQYDYLFFSQQRVVINANGFTASKLVSVRKGRTELSIELAELL